MKAIFLSYIIVLGIVAGSMAADPKKDAATKKKGKEPKVEKVSARDVVAKYDKDGDRKLDKTELSSALRPMKYNTVSTKNDSWKKFDTDHDGKIDEQEMDLILAANVPPPDEDPKPAEEKPKGSPLGRVIERPEK